MKQRIRIVLFLILVFLGIAYLYHGIPGVFGYWVVRFSNFAVFMMTIVVLYSAALSSPSKAIMVS